MNAVQPQDAPAALDLTVSEVAAQSGVASSAVRFYERHGIVTAVRTSGNQRRFDDSAACRIQVARLAQRVGLTVREIADLFAGLPEHPGPSDWAGVAQQLTDTAQQRVDQLRSHLDELGSGAKLCEIGAAAIDQGDDPDPGSSQPRPSTWSIGVTRSSNEPRTL